MKSKRKRIKSNISELLKKIEIKNSEPRHISGIIPDALKDWQNGLARLELEMDAKSVEEYRTKGCSIVNNPKFGAMIYCGTGGQPEKFNEAKDLFFKGKYPYSEEEYKRIINQGFTK